MADTKKEEKKASAVVTKKSASSGQNIITKINDIGVYFQVVYAERGIEPFKVPLLVVLSIFACIYFLVYSKLEPQIMDVSGQLETQKTVAASLGDYNDTKKMIIEYKKKLPMYKDREEWLNYLIISTAKECEVDLEALSPQKMEEQGAFAVASRDVETTVEYDTAGKWIEKLENAPVFLRITNLSMDRIPENPIYVKVKMTISTLFIKD